MSMPLKDSNNGRMNPIEEGSHIKCGCPLLYLKIILLSENGLLRIANENRYGYSFLR